MSTQDTYKGSVWQPWTQNLYVYVGNNPVNYVDPTGHAQQCADDGAGRHEVCFDTNDVDIQNSDEDTLPVDATSATVSTSTSEDNSTVYAVRVYKPVGQGWEYVKEQPHEPNGQRHVHVYDPKGNEVGAWNEDGSVHDKGKPKGKVPKWVKEVVEEKSGIKIPKSVVAAVGTTVIVIAAAFGGGPGSGVDAITGQPGLSMD